MRKNMELLKAAKALEKMYVNVHDHGPCFISCITPGSYESNKDNPTWKAWLRLSAAIRKAETRLCL